MSRIIAKIDVAKRAITDHFVFLELLDRLSFRFLVKTPGVVTCIVLDLLLREVAIFVFYLKVVFILSVVRVAYLRLVKRRYALFLHIAVPRELLLATS